MDHPPRQSSLPSSLIPHLYRPQDQVFPPLAAIWDSPDEPGPSTRPEEPERKPRKTAVACNFCRGRKLRCDGAKPACSNCTVRQFDCEYVPIQRRRGPGKALKGTRSKKARASVPEPDYELAPELRPYTSVLALDLRQDGTDQQ